MKQKTITEAFEDREGGVHLDHNSCARADIGHLLDKVVDFEEDDSPDRNQMISSVFTHRALFAAVFSEIVATDPGLRSKVRNRKANPTPNTRTSKPAVKRHGLRSKR